MEDVGGRGQLGAAGSPLLSRRRGRGGAYVALRNIVSDDDDWRSPIASSKLRMRPSGMLYESTRSLRWATWHARVSAAA